MDSRERPLRSFLLPASGGEVHRERRSSACFGVHEDEPAMRLDGALHDREAETGAADAPGGERLEQPSPQLFRNTGAVVDHAERDGIVDPGIPEELRTRLFE